MHLSVIIPAYNEGKSIVKTLEEINAYLSRQKYDYEILVVNDGSKDRTAEIVKGLLTRIRGLRLIDNKENRGKGYAVRQGMLEARGFFRLFTDADNSTSIDQIEKIWPEVEKGCEVVIGSRDIKGAVLDPPQPWIRNIILGEGFKLFRKIVIGLWGIEDTQCGFKFLTRGATEKIFPKCRIERFAFDPEILVIAKKLGYKIKEIPVYWKNNPNSRVKVMGMIKMALDLLVIRINMIKGFYA